MQRFQSYSSRPPEFWALVRLISERVGYSNRPSAANPEKNLRRYRISECSQALSQLGLPFEYIMDSSGVATELGSDLLRYLNMRSEHLQRAVEPLLMNRDEAEAEFDNLRHQLAPRCALPMNKQKGAKRHHAFLTCIINMLTEAALGGVLFDDDPRFLCAATRDGRPVRLLSRRLDGAYPSVFDPVAIWEIKEYYGTTTFGSRVADGVYESLLDGFEINDAEQATKKTIRHYLIVDDHFTWWDCGRSYLCRIVDMLHMGYLDEALFGREVLAEWPRIVRSWVD